MLADGWELGSHTLSHPDLTAVGPERLRRELVGSREAIQREFGVTANFFCFPYGRFDAAAKAAVRAAGYLAATTTRRGVASPGGDPFALPRISVSTPHLARGAAAPAPRRARLSRHATSGAGLPIRMWRRGCGPSGAHAPVAVVVSGAAGVGPVLPSRPRASLPCCHSPARPRPPRRHRRAGRDRCHAVARGAQLGAGAAP